MASRAEKQHAWPMLPPCGVNLQGFLSVRQPDDDSLPNDCGQGACGAVRPPLRPRRAISKDEIEFSRESWQAGLGLTWATSCRPTRPPRSTFQRPAMRRASLMLRWRTCARARGPPTLGYRILARESVRRPTRAPPWRTLGLPRWPVVPASPGPKSTKNAPQRFRTQSLSSPWIWLAAPPRPRSPHHTHPGRKR